MIEPVDALVRDFSRAIRGLPRRPGFTLATVLTLALGIGATTAIFSVIYSVLLKPLPYPNPDELVRIRQVAAAFNSNDMTTASTQYLTYRDENRTFAEIGAWQEGGATLTGSGEPERIRSLTVTDGLLQALGVQPLRGRSFTAQEHTPAADGPVPVLISYAFWQRRFGGDEAALGSALTLDSQPAQVVGIMPSHFRSPGMTPQPDVIGPVRLDPARLFIGTFDYQALARLAPGVTQDEARADLERMLPIWLDAWPVLAGMTLTRDAIANLRITPVVRSLHDDTVGGVTTTLWVLMGAIGGVLLVACANIANLMLVRADGRRQEFAVRAALGAGAARIARELLVESVVLGAAGGALGLLLAYLGLEALVAIGPSNLPRLEEVAVHPPVLAFTVAISLASTLLFGAITALKHALRIDAIATAGARGSTASRQRHATRNTLVVVQVALALVLTVSAALMIRTFQALRDVQPGFSDAGTVQTANLWMPQINQERGLLMQREILDAVAALPGVTSVGLARQVPLDGNQNNTVIVVQGQEPAAGESPPARRINFVSPGYFETLGTRLIAGRHLTWADVDSGGPVALISEGYARELATEPGAALGLRIRVPVAQDAWREVIGVVEDVYETGLAQDPPRMVYWPVLARNMFGRPAVGVAAPTLVVRSERAGDAVFRNEIFRAIRSVSPDVAAVVERTLADHYAGSLARTSFTLVLLAIAGGMALVLGVIGIYGVIAYVVAQRTREIGIRAALGAQPRELKKLFLRQGLALGAVGAVLGLAAAAALGRSMSTLLFGVEPLDPVAYLAALAVVVLATALATYVPARRAAAVDPMSTLKAE
jgi:putative ABC transport system permease protein